MWRFLICVIVEKQENTKRYALLFFYAGVEKEGILTDRSIL